MRESLQDYCIRTGALHLLAEWDSAANGTRTPETISYGSKQRVHWRCARGHTWEAAVCTRTSHHSGCPVCSGRQVETGVNDLATTHPALARQWHPEKNSPLTPQSVSAGSTRRVWWQCAQGHTWQATVKSRALGGAGCPVCAGRQVEPEVNDLATTHPDIAAQWHPEKNGPLTPRDVSAGSKRQVWWQCSQGHVWQARIASRVAGRGCPVCAGRRIVPGENDLAASHPALAAQWHPEKNGILTPQQVSPHSNRKVWWQCDRGHAWQATPASRVRGTGCPYCSGRKVPLASTTSPAAIPLSRASGSRHSMARSRPSRSPHPATKKSGGSAHPGTSGRRASPAAPTAPPAVPSAPAEQTPATSPCRSAANDTRRK